MNERVYSENLMLFQMLGRRHLSEQKNNEDVAVMKDTARFSFLGLADGQSGKTFCVQGGTRILAEIYQFFINFPRLDVGKCSLNELQMKIAVIIQRELISLASAFHADVAEFSSTLVVLAIDKSSGRYVSIHLGDGAIVGTTKGGEVTIISRPENGITNQYTWLTTSPAFIRHLRICFGSTKNYKTLFLFSDGAQPLLLNQGILNRGDASIFASYLKQIKPVDDASCIIYNCEKKE